MFARWGDLVHRLRFTVIGVMVALLLGLAGYGLSLNDHLSQSGFDDPGSESVRAAKLADGTFGRDANGDVVALYTAPAGQTVDSQPFYDTVAAAQNKLVADHPDRIAKINASYFTGKLPALATPDKTKAIATFAIVGNNDTELASNFRDVKNAFGIDGVDVQLAGLQPIAGALNDTLASDVHRMELLAIPVVGVLLFFIFGGVVAAALPLIIGGLTVVAANGVVRFITNFFEVNTFVAPVVSLVGLGLAIDYGLFIVSRFREELGDGYSTKQAVRRSVMTAGRTVVFSATMIVASLGGLLLFPQGFLKSVAFGAIATVALAALTSITVLPAILAILGPRVDALGFKFMRKTKSSEEIENGPWGRLTRWVMRNPLKVAVPIVLGLLLLTLPVGNIKFGGINESYLPPDNPTRVAQNEFDANFPSYRTEPLKIVLQNAQGPQIGTLLREASNAPGLVDKFALTQNQNGVAVLSAGLVDRNDSKPAIEYIRALDVPDGVTMSVGGTPTLEQDSIAALVDRLPLMAVLVVLVVTLLMFLTFGSLVLPIKAILMTTLGLGATLGILTWIFIDGNGAGLLDFSPGPIMAPILVLIIAIIFGLSTDYEVFLLSRMVEARARGASTSEAIRVGTSHTGRIITAAALILIVVTGAFAFSDLVMMKYIAYGMIAALVIDATLIRMFLVPSIMKMLGDDCWWAPAWMKRIQEKLGLGEPVLEAELMPDDVPELAVSGLPMFAGSASEPLTTPIPRIAPHVPAVRPSAGGAPTRVSRVDEPRRSATGRPAVAPGDEVPVPADTRAEPTRRRPAVRAESDQPHPDHPSAPEPRPIESWLAELRSPTAKKPDGEPRRPLPQPDTTARPEDSRSDRTPASAPTPNGRRSGAEVNGNGGNGNGSSGNGSTNGSGNGSPVRPVPAVRPVRRPEPAMQRDNQSMDQWFAELRGPATRTSPDAERSDVVEPSADMPPAPPVVDPPSPRRRAQPTYRSESASAPSVPTEARTSSARPNPLTDPVPEPQPQRQPASPVAEVAPQPEPQPPRTGETGGRRRRAEPEQSSDDGGSGSGRHGGRSGQAISVSELLARQRRS
ncbi:MMPL family transporter [Actinomycetes bacterium M1A6_2h]